MTKNSLFAANPKITSLIILFNHYSKFSFYDKAKHLRGTHLTENKESFTIGGKDTFCELKNMLEKTLLYHESFPTSFTNRYYFLWD